VPFPLGFGEGQSTVSGRLNRTSHCVS
jgi:hypothetical protein